MLLPAHEAVRYGDQVAEESRRQLDRFRKIEGEVLSILRGSDWSMLNEVANEVVRRILVGRSDDATFTEVNTVHSCLERLVFEGKVRFVKGGYSVRV